MTFRRELPPPEALREAVFEGTLFLLPPSAASLAFVRAVEDALCQELGPEPRLAQHRLGGRAIFEAVGRLRRRIYLEPSFHAHVRAVAGSLGLARDRLAFDPARLRAVLSAGHEEPAARAAYYAHRDTWYANPPSIITVWIPLHDATPEETFVFYRDRFGREVVNDSCSFDYDAWVDDDWSNKIGWQRYETGISTLYPRSDVVAAAGPATGFACRRGEVLLFSGAHYHQTRRHNSGRTRFSLDFRCVHLDDVEAGRGAPDVDNLSQGSCLVHYVHPDRPWPP